jgi:hypothetical protein
MSAPQSSCFASDSLPVNRFARGDHVNRLLLADSAWQGVEQASRCCYEDADDSALRGQSTFPLKLPP